MNRHVPLTAEKLVGPGSPLKALTRAQERAAFRSLALTQKRISWAYYKWAREAEQAGDLVEYRRCRDRSDSYRKDAREHIEHARIRSQL